MIDKYTNDDTKVAVTIALNKKGEVISVCDQNGKPAEFFSDLTEPKPKGEVQYFHAMGTLIIKENPCWAWYYTSRGYFRVQVPC